MKIKKRIKLLLVLLVIITGTTAFYRDDPRNYEITKNLDIFFSVFKEINTLYVDEIDPGKSIKTAIDAMLAELDPYTVFYPESKIEEFKFMTTGEYGGIGAIVQRRAKKVVIIETYQNYPAAKAGLKPGDEILSIDDVNVSSKTLDEISELLKGKDNTILKMQITRPGITNPKNFLLTRSKINISPVPFADAVDSIGYIRFTSFTDNSAASFGKALNNLLINKKISSLIIDLRGNPGGLLNQAINIVNFFIPKGNLVVETRGKVKDWNTKYRTQNQAIDTSIPIVVLVNEGSASASEIVSGSLQDLDRAVVVGHRTYGKGLVQTTRKLAYHTRLKVTTAKYYIPSGRCIQALDYTHRRADGSVFQIPDSLISEFTTRNGRKVFDGAGIQPDILSDSLKYDENLRTIFQKNYIFDYATLFAVNHNSIPKIRNFFVNDSILNDFYNFLNQKNFKFTSKEQKSLKSFKNSLTSSNRSNREILQYITELNKILSEQNNIKKLDSPIIKRYLGMEIVGRYYYQKGRLAYNLRHDKMIDTAYYILRHPDYYQKILMGKEGEHRK